MFLKWKYKIHVLHINVGIMIADVELNCVDEVKGARDRYYSLVQTFALVSVDFIIFLC
jgi:hypothetical protein